MRVTATFEVNLKSFDGRWESRKKKIWRAISGMRSHNHTYLSLIHTNRERSCTIAGWPKGVGEWSGINAIQRVIVEQAKGRNSGGGRFRPSRK